MWNPARGATNAGPASRRRRARRGGGGPAAASGVTRGRRRYLGRARRRPRVEAVAASPAGARRRRRIGGRRPRWRSRRRLERAGARRPGSKRPGGDAVSGGVLVAGWRPAARGSASASGDRRRLRRWRCRRRRPKRRRLAARRVARGVIDASSRQCRRRARPRRSASASRSGRALGLVVVVRRRGVAERGHLLGADHRAARHLCRLVDGRLDGLRAAGRRRARGGTRTRCGAAGGPGPGRTGCRRATSTDSTSWMVSRRWRSSRRSAGDGHLQARLEQLGDLGDVRRQRARSILPAVAEDVDGLVGRDHGWSVPPARMPEMWRIRSGCAAMVRSRRSHEAVRGVSRCGGRRQGGAAPPFSGGPDRAPRHRRATNL